MSKKVKRERRTPQYGAHFGCLLITDNDNNRVRREYKQYLDATGVEIRHVWKPSDSRLALDQRKPPPDTEIVIFDHSASINAQQKARLEWEYKKKLGRFVVTDKLRPHDCAVRLVEHGFVAPPIEAEAAIMKKEAPPPAPDVGTEMPPDPHVHVEADEQAPPAVDIKPCATRAEAGALLKQLRQKKKETAAQVAGLLGCSESYLYSIEQGKGSPANSVCLWLEKHYGLPSGTLPRLAHRENHELAKKHKLVAPEPPPPPPPVQTELPHVEAAPEPVLPPPAPLARIPEAPAAVVEAEIVTSRPVGRGAWEAFLAALGPDDVLSFLGAFRRHMPRLGVSDVVVRTRRPGQPARLLVNLTDDDV
jgi:transcriptional regulator with XRE-family HTH domain